MTRKKTFLFVVACILIITSVYLYKQQYKPQNRLKYSYIHKNINNAYMEALLNTKFNQLIIKAEESIDTQKTIYKHFSCQDNHFLKVYINSWLDFANRIDANHNNPLTLDIINHYKQMTVGNLNCVITQATQNYIDYIKQYQNAPLHLHLASLMPCKTIYYYIYNKIMVNYDLGQNYDKLYPDIQEFLQLYAQPSALAGLDSFEKIIDQEIPLNHTNINKYISVYERGIELEKDFFNYNYY